MKSRTTAPSVGHQEPCRLARTVEPQCAADEPAEHGTGNPQQYRDDEAARIPPGINSLAMTPTTRPNTIQTKYTEHNFLRQLREPQKPVPA
jgi:hypothetical protein